MDLIQIDRRCLTTFPADRMRHAPDASPRPYQDSPPLPMKKSRLRTGIKILWGLVAVCLIVWSLRCSLSAHQPITPKSANGIGAKAIEQLRVGDRVWTGVAEAAPQPDTPVDPRSWRLLKLRSEMRWDDGTIDDINVETLQPPEWVKTHGARVGAIVALPMDLVEMGMPETLRAQVVSNEPCPPIRRGPGRLILSTINHLNSAVHELTLEDANGRRELIRPTTWHKFCRDSDGAWISTRDFSAGDTIRGKSGPLTVISNVRVPGVHRVYNMTIDAEHVYRVSLLGALGHNPGCGPDVPPAGPSGMPDPALLPPNAKIPPGARVLEVRPDGTVVLDFGPGAPPGIFQPNGNGRQIPPPPPAPPGFPKPGPGF